MTKIQIGKNEDKQIVIRDPGVYRVELVGPGARAEVLGAFEVGGLEKAVFDITTHHKAENTRAETFLRAVVRDRAQVILTGLIKIDKGAEKTDAFLRENILLLSDTAWAEAVPNLEIDAHDVRASHAATVGKIDEEQMFYLMSRGIRRAEAQGMIVDGFLRAVRERIKKQE